MKPYHKIQSMFKRDPATKHKTFLDGQFSRPEFEILRNIPWRWDEKVDGTNVRVIVERDSRRFAGRSENAHMPMHLVDQLREIFTKAKCMDLWTKAEGTVTLYGEGFGHKIQSGGWYLDDHCDFYLFDVRVGDVWLTRESVLEVAQEMGIRPPTEVGIGTLDEAIEVVQGNPISRIAENEPGRSMEGFVLRPVHELLDRRGDRIITKLKCRDLDHAV